MTGEQIKVDDFSNNNLSNLHETILRSSFFFSLNTCSSRLVSSIIRLLDDSVESLTALNSPFVKFKRFNEKKEILANEDLMKILSAGTFRGVELYIRCIDVLKYGKTIIIDEIKTSFQKNLVYKLLFLFNDGEINSKRAQMIFSTHYVEILDYLSRRDNIYIAHKNDGRIMVNNLYMGYKVRTELLKSKQFNNNVFNTSFSYENLLALNQATHEEPKVKE